MTWRISRWLRGAAIMLAVLGGASTRAGLVEGVKAMPPLKPGTPERTEVLFSVRFPRADAVDAARAFGATRTVWHYATSAPFVARMQGVVPRTGLSMNANGPVTDPAGRAQDFDGQPLTAPWMKAWNVFWASYTHPAAREGSAAEVRRLLGLGADTIQFDDPTLQLFAGLYQAGDFNPATQKGFRPWLDRHLSPQELRQLGLDTLGDDYREWLMVRHGVKDARDYLQRSRGFPSTALWLRYLRATVVEHFTWLKQELRTVAGRPVPLSMNLSVLFEPADSNPHYFLAFEADFAMSETQIIDPSRMVSQWAVARSAGLGSAASILPRGRGENRVAIAHLFALGATPLVPWDTYNGNDEQGRAQRFYGTPEDYGDLFRFVRRFPQLHDRLEVAPLAGVVVPVQANQADRVRRFVKRLHDRQIPYRYVFAGDKDHGRPDSRALQSLDRLWLVGEPEQLAPDERAALEAGRRVPMLSDKQVTDDELDLIRPVLTAPGQANMRWVARVEPGRADRLVLHLVDAARGDVAAPEAECRRRVGIDPAWLDGRTVAGIRAYALEDDAPVDLALQRTPGATFVTVPRCSLWTILEMRLR